MDDGMIGEEDLPTDFHAFQTAKETDRSKSEGGRGEFTMADLTTDAFRRKFLEHNRMWLLDQLSELLTPRTLKKFRKMGGKFAGLGSRGLHSSTSQLNLSRFGQ
jgi:hypothetical protein